MAINGIITSQTGARQFNPKNFTSYSYFVGGVNATNHALRNYSPLLNNYGRLFMVRAPRVLLKMFGGKSMYSADSQFVQFKHMLEYMNRSVTGFNDKELAAAGTTIQGGYAGREFSTPTVTKETTNEITTGLYEFVGMPVFTVVDAWMNAIGDENSGYATYGGYISGGSDGSNEKRLSKVTGDEDVAYAFNEAEHTAEFIYVLTDRSGAQVERAVMLADCWPKRINQGNALNSDQPGNHDNVTYDITWNCVVYRSVIINAIANDLLKTYRVVSNSLNFNPELGDALYNSAYEIDTAAEMHHKASDNALNTNIGNTPVFKATNAPTTTSTAAIDVNVGTGRATKTTGGTFSET